MDYILTVEGGRYMARVNAQMMPMHLARVDVGSGTSGQPEQLTELANKKQTIQIDSIEQDGNTAVLHCMLTNLELHTGYQLQQAGVYAHDAVDNKDVLIFVGQDERGEWIPPIEEREAQWLHNIGLQVSTTKEITFDLRVNDFVRKGYLEDRLEDRGRVLVGPINTEIGENDILLILEDEFQVAAVSNIELSQEPPADADANWGAVRIVEGKLTVAQMPEADTTFFAQIGDDRNGE